MKMQVCLEASRAVESALRREEAMADRIGRARRERCVPDGRKGRFGDLLPRLDPRSDEGRRLNLSVTGALRRAFLTAEERFLLGTEGDDIGG